MFLQTVLVTGLSSAADDEDTAGAGSVGVLMSFMWLVACALVLAFPMASMIIFGLAGLLGIAVGASSEFADLVVWGIISLVLALMSFFGWRGKKRDKAAAEAERHYQRDRDAKMESLLRGQQTQAASATSTPPTAPWDMQTCSSCGASNGKGVKFCGECGASLAAMHA
jgi:hypothetical protein